VDVHVRRASNDDIDKCQASENPDIGQCGDTVGTALHFPQPQMYASSTQEGPRNMTSSQKPDEAHLPQQENFESLLSRSGVLVERITSYGNVTPADQPYCQPHDEWVMVIHTQSR
jgi:hypothetical protein